MGMVHTLILQIKNKEQRINIKASIREDCYPSIGSLLCVMNLETFERA